MFNKDLVKQQTQQSMQKISDALASNNVEAAAEALQEMQNGICESIEAEFNQYRDVTDMNVLQQRGLRTLTSEETAWYQKFISAVKSGAKQEVTDIGKAIPVTIFDRVIEDMQANHPLLSAITFEDAAGAMRLVLNGIQISAQLGAWGALGSAISTEVKGKVKVIDVTAAKYTAYFLVPKDFIKFNFGFAPMWVDQYVRRVLSECIANGLEKTIINGDGDGQFIGMAYDTSTAKEGKHTEKAAIALSSWDDYAGVIADNLVVDENGDYRNLDRVLLVVNPKDYIKKVRPAQNVVTTAGVVTNVLDILFPTDVATSPFVKEGTAKLGIAKNYFTAINGGTSGIIEFSDENQFLEDNRVYTTRVYGNGRPVDNKSFVNLDISALTETPGLPVSVKNTVKTKTQTA